MLLHQTAKYRKHNGISPVCHLELELYLRSLSDKYTLYCERGEYKASRPGVHRARGGTSGPFFYSRKIPERPDLHRVSWCCLSPCGGTVKGQAKLGRRCWACRSSARIAGRSPPKAFRTGDVPTPCRVVMVMLWLAGDLMKAAYYTNIAAPIQLAMCACFQILMDLVILCQFSLYRKPRPRSREEEARQLDRSSIKVSEPSIPSAHNDGIQLTSSTEP